MNMFDDLSCDQIELIATDTLSQRDIRSLIFHVLYAAEAYEYELSVAAVIDMLSRGYKLTIAPESALVRTATGVITDRESLDAVIKPLLHNWRFDRLSVATKLILRMALWECLHTDTVSNIIINEAIELAKCFAEDDAYKFINGILDEYVKNTGRAVGAPAVQ